MKKIIEHIERLFPKTHIQYEGEAFGNDGHGETDYAPPMEISWAEFVNKLEENGLEIRWKK